MAYNTYIFMFVTVLSLGVTWSQKNALKIAVLYNSQFHPAEPLILKHAVYRINEDPLILPKHKIVLDIIDVKSKDLFSSEMTGKLSEILSMFALSDTTHQSHLIAKSLKIPLMRLYPLVDTIHNDYTFSIRPGYEILDKAMTEFLHYLKLDELAIVYDSRRDRQATHLYSLIKLKSPFMDVQLMPRLALQPGQNQKFEEAITELLKSHIKNVVMLCDSADNEKIMKKAIYMGVNFTNFKWIASEVDVTGDMDLPAIRGLAGFRLFMPNVNEVKNLLKIIKDKRKSEASKEIIYASIYDSAWVVAKALHARVLGNWSMPSFDSSQCPMQKALSNDGKTLLDSIKNVTHNGLTGQVTFDRYGNRKVDSGGLDIVNLVYDPEAGNGGVFKKVGSWKPIPGINENSVNMGSSSPIRWTGDKQNLKAIVRWASSNADPQQSIKKRKTLRITSNPEEPFVLVNDFDQYGNPLKGNKRFTGFLVELVRMVATAMKMDYEITIVKDKTMGNEVNGRWNGMIGELVYKRADVAMGAMTITSGREKVIDFSKPFMDFYMSLIMKKPAEAEVNFFDFLLPFAPDVWGGMTGAVFAMMILLYLIDYLSPYGHRAEGRETGEGGDEFSLHNSLWMATASMLQQGPDDTPKTLSGRVLVTAYWFFILILISTYTANLAAFFTISRSGGSIKSLADLVKSDMKYGVKRGSSLHNFFEASEVRVYRQMYGKMRTMDSFANSTGSAIDMVRKGNYAYMTDHPVLDYRNNHKPCNTMLLTNLLEAKNYGFGLQKNSEFTDTFSINLLKLRENGTVTELRLKYWDNVSECPKPKKVSGAESARLGFHNLAGVFIVLAAGTTVAIIMVFIEIKVKHLTDYLKDKGFMKADDKSSEGSPPPVSERDVASLPAGAKIRSRDPDIYAQHI